MENFNETKVVDVNIVELATELARNAVLKDAGYQEKAIVDEKDGWVKYKDEVQEDFDSYYDYYYTILNNFK